MVFKEIFSSCPVIDVPVEAGGDEVVATMSAKTLRIGTRSDLIVVSVAGGFIAVLTKALVDGLVGVMIGVGTDVFAEFGIVVVVSTAIALEIFVTISCAGDVRAGVSTGTAVDSDVTIATRDGAVVVVVLIDLLADTIICFVAGIGIDVSAGVDVTTVAAAVADAEFTETRVSLEDALRCS